MKRITFVILTVLLLQSIATWGGTAELKTARFRLRFGDDGKPASLRALPSDEELLDVRSKHDVGFYLEAADHKRTPLSTVGVGGDGRLTARSADGKQSVIFGVRTADCYLALRIERLDGIPGKFGTSLHFEMNGSGRIRVTELDYMTRVQNESYGVRVHWDDIWHQRAGDPLGGVALFVRQSDADEDETLLRIWVGEALAHPKVNGEWTLDRARSWVADWQKLFADRSQMILEGENLDELRAALPWAERARIKEIYLFTQTWRTDNFWPGDHGNIDVNRNVFPHGEDDLRAFSDLLCAKGMRLNLHYVSGGVGRTDPQYVGTKPDRRLAGWVRGSLAKAASLNDPELAFRPEAGATYPPLLPHFYEHNHVRIEDEIVRVGSFEIAADGIWTLRKCGRGQFLTKAVEHASGTEGQGLVVAYGQNYVPDNDSTLLDEVAVNYAQFVNRCGIGHTEYDGAEIHTYNGRWGYLKFATKVYKNVDHLVTAHDSSGNAPRCNFEYRFNSSQKTLRGTCRFTHGNWSAPVELASPSRVASTLLDANFVLSQGHLGGAMGLCKPEPMFAVSDRSLKVHGLSDAIIETLLNWKVAAPLLTDEQRAEIDASFVSPTNQMPEGSRHAASRFVQVVRKCADGFQIVPVCVMTRKSGDILWQQGQEHGAISPRQYMKPGDELALENPFAAQPAKFIIHVLWTFDSHGPSETLKENGNETGLQKHPADAFTAGNNGRHIAQTNVRPNLVLQPTLANHCFSGDGALKQSVTNDDSALHLTAENPDANEVWADLRKLPEWSAPMDMTGRRGVGMRVTGDGSGSLLVLAISGRDYVVPVDFTGTRDIEIPNGEVAWASGAWGWRMDTKHADYAHQHACRIGFGYLPAKTKTSIQVESITALAEIPAQLENPVIRTGTGSLTVRGVVTSGQYLQYQGGDTASVFDENWNKIRDLPVEKEDYTMPAGFAPASVMAKTKPWLEVQFMTEGDRMIVRP